MTLRLRQRALSVPAVNSSEYPGARIVRLNHQEMAPGDPCPESGCEGHLHQFYHQARMQESCGAPLPESVQFELGSLVEVGRGRASVEDFARLIQNPRSQSPLVPARVTAPASGLFLESVDY